MPVRRPAKPKPPPLDQRLTLAAWFVDQLGYSGNREMLDDLKDSGEDWDGGPHPALARAVNRSGTGVKIPPDALAEMDDNIHSDLAALNRRRSPRVSLKYFQYLAALAVENFLRRLAAGPERLLADLRQFAERRGGHFPRPESAGDLRKLALWIATGGGKTLLMHLNRRQFLRRKSGLFSPDNVILLTPNETLSAQHLAEMRLSGVPCFRHGEERGGLGATGENPVRVLEITKLAPKSGAKSVSIDEFADSRNLVLVDEGHKGAGGKAWFERKRRLAEKGFLIEYSATFGQAVAAADRERAEEYAHAIALDYSYRHFHGDGYGKDFDVVNLPKDPEEKRRDALMLGNLLVFLQQRMCFAENRESFSRRNLEPPLLLMLGATVTGKRDRQTTDIAKFAGFLHRAALDQNRSGEAWLEETAGRILSGASGIADANGDVFAHRLDWLGRRFGEDGGGVNAGKVCAALREHVFRAGSPGALQFCSIPGAKGEAALRVGGGLPFGLVYVGDVIPQLRKIVREHSPGIMPIEDSSLGRYFPEVAGPNSPINILVGAKKFMEGWNSWRVSGMGLLRVGVGEGPLVFQLFGRGVRLKGAGMSLKRGGSPGAPPPPDLPLLETMNIFGVEANFIAKFREALEREGVWKETLHLPTKPPPAAALAKLLAPEYSGKEFKDAVWLESSEKISAELDLSSTAIRIAAGEAARRGGAAKAPSPQPFSPKALAAVNRDQLRRRLLDYRARSEKWNMIFPPGNLEAILRERCSVICDADAPLEPTSRRNFRRIQDAAFAVMRKYADKFYNARRGEWELKNIGYAPLAEDHPNFPKPEVGYSLRVPHSAESFINGIRGLVADRAKLEAMWDSESIFPPRVHFCRHLYQPLLLAEALKEKEIEASPPGLNKGEADFVEKLRRHVKSGGLAAGEEIFLLRNQSRSGLGFHGESGGAYPDFILWKRRGKKQRVIFVEPHGMTHARAYASDPNARLHEWLIPVNRKLAKQSPNVEMDSFVVSQTPFSDLQPAYGDGGWRPENFAAKHILFAEDDYIAEILRDPE